MQALIITDASWERDPHLNVAMEEAIHRNIEDTAILRFWKNDNAVVIGRCQCPFVEINQDTCARLGTKLVRRHTGGGAVYHDPGNLNISLALPKKTSALDSFRFLRNMFIIAIVSALENVVDGPYLTNESSIFTKSGCKVCGVAGSVNKPGYLIHASLLISSDLERLRSILASDYKTPAGFVASQHSDVTNLQYEKRRPLSIDQIKQLIACQIITTFKFRKSSKTLSQAIIDEAQKLADDQYRRNEWLLEPCMMQNASCIRNVLNVPMGNMLLEKVDALFVRP